MPVCVLCPFCFAWQSKKEKKSCFYPFLRAGNFIHFATFYMGNYKKFIIKKH